MTQSTRPPFPPYTGQSPQPLRRRPRWPEWLTRDVKPKDAVLFILAALAALGFTNPIRRITALETRVSGLEEAQRFTNYMLCVNARRTDPASAPPDCAPLIEARTPRAP